VSSSIPDELFTATGVWAQPREHSAPSQRTPRSEDEALMARVQRVTNLRSDNSLNDTRA
jgi:hypothetical protein